MQYSKKLNITLWTVQALLALFFAFGSGLPKLILPIDKLALPIELPELFIRFIGVAEVLGALGLILPGLTRIRPGLTPLAALGLVVVAVGATVYQVVAGKPGNAIFALAVALVAAFVAYGRTRLVPPRGRESSRPAVLQGAG